MKDEQELIEEGPEYEPPALTVLGSASELTRGPSHGSGTDGLFPHQSSM